MGLSVPPAVPATVPSVHTQYRQYGQIVKGDFRGFTRSRTGCTTVGAFGFADGAGALEWRLGKTTVFLADGRTFEIAEFPSPLPYFQLRDLFGGAQLDAVVDHPRWAERYPSVAEMRKASDPLARDRVTLPGEIVLAAARACECVGDLYADVDGETLHMTGHGRMPFRLHQRGSETVVEEIADAVKMSPERAIREFGSDAVWLAQEYGKSRRGQRDDRYRRPPPIEPPERATPRPPDVESQIQRAQEALKVFLRPGHTRGDVFAAIRIWKGLAPLRPDWLEPHRALADLYTELDLLPEAKANLQKLADACLARGDAPAAEAPLRRVLELDPADLRARGKLADVCEQLGKRSDAIDQHAAIADGLWERGHRAEAIHVLEQGLRKLGETPALRSRLEAFRRSP